MPKKIFNSMGIFAIPFSLSFKFILKLSSLIELDDLSISYQLKNSFKNLSPDKNSQCTGQAAQDTFI